MRSFRLHLRTARSSKAAQTVLRLSIVWLRHHSFELSVIRISHNPGVKTVCFLTSVFTSLHHKNLMRKHPCSYDDDDRTPYTGLHSHGQFPLSCVMFRGAQAETCLCGCSYTMPPLWAHAWYVVTPLPPCHRVALKLWFLLLPPAFYSRPPMGFFFFFFSFGALELAKCCVDNSASPRFFFSYFFYQVARLFHVRRWHLRLAEYLKGNVGCSHISELEMRDYLRVILFRKCAIFFFRRRCYSS